MVRMYLGAGVPAANSYTTLTSPLADEPSSPMYRSARPPADVAGREEVQAPPRNSAMPLGEADVSEHFYGSVRLYDCTFQFSETPFAALKIFLEEGVTLHKESFSHIKGCIAKSDNLRCGRTVGAHDRSRAKVV
jgi:hypothetical protein